MNIHFGKTKEGFVRISSETAKSQGFSLRSDEGTEPARTRPGQTYPGGRQLRRKLGALNARRKFFVLRGQGGHTEPGTMTSA